MRWALLVEAFGYGSGEVEECRSGGVSRSEAMLVVGWWKVFGDGGKYEGFKYLHGRAEEGDRAVGGGQYGVLPRFGDRDSS